MNLRAEPHAQISSVNCSAQVAKQPGLHSTQTAFKTEECVRAYVCGCVVAGGCARRRVLVGENVPNPNSDNDLLCQISANLINI